jgi:hypothetical protein
LNDSGTPPKYDLTKVEAIILEIAAELHPQHLAADDFLSKIISDRDDSREVKTAMRAICNLREFGLFQRREDEVVEPTPAALRAIALCV